MTANFSLFPLVNPKTFCTFAIKISYKYVFIMARPIRETPVLKGEDAFRSTFGRLQGKNFEMRRLVIVCDSFPLLQIIR